MHLSLIFLPQAQYEGCQTLFNPLAQQRSIGSLNGSFDELLTTTPTNEVPDASTVDLIKTHVEMIKKVLKVILLSMKRLALTEETWIIVLKVLLGITDCLFCTTDDKKTFFANDGTKIYCKAAIADEVGVDLIRIFIEVWCRSKIETVDMWDHLKVKNSFIYYLRC